MSVLMMDDILQVDIIECAPDQGLDLNVVAACIRFFSCQMKPGWSYKEWVSELRDIAQSCQFVCESQDCRSVYTDRCIRDVLILNTPHPQVRQRALEMRNPTLDDVLLMAEEFEGETSEKALLEVDTSTRNSSCKERIDPNWKKASHESHQKKNVTKSTPKTNPNSSKTEKQIAKSNTSKRKNAKNATETPIKTYKRACGPKRIRCDHCGKMFLWLSQLRIHLEIHSASGRNLFPCPDCGKPFALKRYAKIHCSRLEQQKKVICELCGAQLMGAQSLSTHMKVHREGPRFKCSFCDKAFNYKRNMLGHEVAVHRQERKYQCDTCGQRFVTGNALKLHQTRHTSERQFECPQCERKFRRKDGLKQHLRTHSDKKDFICDVCGQQFRNKSKLNAHSVNIHSDTPKFQCQICQKRCIDSTCLKRHMYSQHKCGPKPRISPSHCRNKTRQPNLDFEPVPQPSIYSTDTINTASHPVVSEGNAAVQNFSDYNAAFYTFNGYNLV